MTTERIWAGETPYDALSSFDGFPEQNAEGYRAAMNSDVVKGLYEALHEMANQFLEHDSVGWRKRMTDDVMQTLAAYEKGLRA